MASNAICMLLVVLGALLVTPSLARPVAVRAPLHTQPSKPMKDLWPRPPHEEVARMARWLAHVTEWGVLATVGKGEFPVISGSVSHSDGPIPQPTGRIFFYLTPMDELTQNIDTQPLASYTLSEAQVAPEGCGDSDAEDPVCARATFLGQVVRVKDSEVDMAQQAMFARHPAMASWPPGHHFAMYEFIVQQVHVLDFYGGMAYVDHASYYKASLDPAPATKTATAANEVTAASTS